MPLRGEGMSRPKSFLMGVLSGAVEPVAGVLTILAAGIIVPVLPYLYLQRNSQEELIPEMSEGGSNIGTVLFAVGFSVMMILDVALG